MLAPGGRLVPTRCHSSRGGITRHGDGTGHWLCPMLSLVRVATTLPSRPHGRSPLPE